MQLNQCCVASQNRQTSNLTKLLYAPIILGGPGTVVQIPCLFIIESYISYDLPHTSFSLQNGHGCRPGQEQWVLGMVDISTRPAVGYMELVQENSSYTNANH